MGTSFQTIAFNGGGYTVGGNGIVLTDSLVLGGSFSGAVTILLPIDVQANAVTIHGGGDGPATLGGGLSGTGAITFLGGRTQISGNLSATSPITLGGGSILDFYGAHTYTGTFTLAGGTLYLHDALLANASVLATTPILVGGSYSSSALVGSGTIGALTGTGYPSFQLGPEMLNIGSITGTTDGGAFSLGVNIRGVTAGIDYGQANVTGAISLGNRFSAYFSMSSSFVPTAGQEFILIKNDGTDPLNGTFVGLPEGSVITLNSVYKLRLSYAGGDGNDVALVLVTAPDPPTGVAATGGNAQATVSFTPPSNNGGSPITSYKVTSNPGGVTASGAVSPVTVTGLINGTVYAFAVTATSAAGTGPASASSNSVTPVAPQAISFGTLSNRALGSAPFMVSATGGASGNPIVFSSLTIGVCTTSGTNGTTVTLLALGLCTIAANQAGSDTYAAASQVTQTFEVIPPAAQAISFGTLSNRALGSAPFMVSATGGASGNPVVFSSLTIGVCTTSGTNGTTVTLLALGTCTIAANQAGSDSYAAAPQVTQSFAVSPPAPPGAVQRAFVASSGMDSNTATGCGLGHPCRSFAAAMTIVDNDGVIVALDAAGYGAVTINRSVTIAASPGFYAGIAASTGDAVTIATGGVNVTLRGLNINGNGGEHGVYMNNGARLSIENCVISNFSDGSGVSVHTPATVSIIDSIIRDNKNSHGVFLSNGAAATISGSKIVGNAIYGVYVFGNGTSITTAAAISDSVVSGNSFGVFALSTTTASASVSVTRSTLSNGGYGAYVTASSGGTAVLTVSNSMVTGNAIGLAQVGIAVLESLGNNTVRQNGTDTTGTITLGSPR